MADLNLRPTEGLIDGETVQIAEGRYLGVVGAGLAMTEEAFDLVEPHIVAACPTWTSGRRYGVFELSAADRQRLAQCLSDASDATQSATTSGLFEKLADWLNARCDVKLPISIFGY